MQYILERILQQVIDMAPVQVEHLKLKTEAPLTVLAQLLLCFAVVMRAAIESQVRISI